MVIFNVEKKGYFLLNISLPGCNLLINSKNCPQISGQKVYHSTLMVLLGSTKAIQDPMQKHFVRDMEKEEPRLQIGVLRKGKKRRFWGTYSKVHSGTIT